MVRGEGQISEAELAAFVDDSLTPRRRAYVAAHIERSSELRVLVGEQRAALDAVRALDAPAPARLRARVLPEPSRLPTRRHARFRPVVLAVAAAIAGVPFANHDARLGWHAIGTRADKFEGRKLRTVFRARGGRRIAYSIVAGHALAWPADARRMLRDGTELRHLRRGRGTIVTLLRAGHRCLLSGARLSSDELLELAAWNGSRDTTRVPNGLLPPAPAIHRPAA
jgi:anti-sigma factor RsiW